MTAREQLQKLIGDGDFDIMPLEKVKEELQRLLLIEDAMLEDSFIGNNAPAETEWGDVA